MKSFLRTLAVVAIVLAAYGTAHAQTSSWNAPSGNWSLTGNWTNGIPGTGTNAVINNGGIATLDTNALNLGSLTIGSSSLLRKDNSVTGRSISGTVTSGLITNSGTIRYGQGSGGNFSITSGSSGWNNSGLITADVVGAELRVAVNANNIFVINTGTIEADGGVLAFANSGGSGSFNMTNTGGTLRVTRSGTLLFRGGTRITGGNLSIDAGSVFHFNRTNERADLTNVTVTNAGQMFTNQPANNNSMSINFLGTTTLANSGTLEYITSGSVAAATGPIASGSAASASNITNQATGLIRIANNNTSAAAPANAFFGIGTPNFTNQGRIEVFSAAGLTTGSSQLRSGTNVSNAGAILVDGPVSSIEMGARTFTQTAGSLSLVNGGRMTAGSVLINSGTLLGTGTIAAPVTVGGIVSPGNVGIGTLTVTNGVTWNAGNDWLFTLGTPAASLNDAVTTSDADLLSLTGAFTQGTGSTFTFDFATSGSDGWYKLVEYASTTFATGTNTSFAATGLPAGKTANFVVDSSSTALYVQIVPEPGTLVLAGVGIGLAGFVVSRRRRRG